MEPTSKKQKTDVIQTEQSSNQMTLQNLPVELQDKIFGYLTNPHDLINLCGTAKQFQRMLEPSKLKWSFHEVLKIMLTREKQNPDFSWIDQWTDFKNIRLVCKSWNRACTRILENDQSHFSVDWDAHSRLQLRHLNATYPVTFNLYDVVKEVEPDRIQRFTNYFLDQQANRLSYNPIPTRHVHIKFQLGLHIPVWKAFSVQIKRFLEAFGKHVWYLTIGDGTVFENPDLAIVYTYLSEWAELMPSIKSLVCNFMGRDNATQLTPFPHLKNLESCQFGTYCGTAAHILKTNQHVRKVGMINSLVLPKIMKMNFSSQLELVLSQVLADDMFTGETISCKMKKLSLECVGPLLFIKRFMSFFRKLKRSSLQCLDLDLSGVTITYDPLQEVLDLPNLKNLRLKLPTGCFVDLDWFLGNLVSLQTLTLEIKNFDDAFLSDESNYQIWDVQSYANITLNETAEEEEKSDVSSSSSAGENLEEEKVGLLPLEDDNRSNLLDVPTNENEGTCPTSPDGENPEKSIVDISPSQGENEAVKMEVQSPERKILEEDNVSMPVIESVELNESLLPSKDENLQEEKQSEISYDEDQDLEYVDRLLGASLWHDLPQLKTVNVKTFYDGEKYHRCYTLPRPGMSELTFHLYHVDESYFGDTVYLIG